MTPQTTTTSSRAFDAAGGSHQAKAALAFTVELDAEQLTALAHQVAAILAADGALAGAPRPKYLDAAGAAEYLACSRDRIYDLVQVGKLQVERDGRRLLFRREDLDAYVAEQP